MEAQPLSKNQLEPYFGALAIMANADGHLAPPEIVAFRAKLTEHGVADAEARQLSALLAGPPPVAEVADSLRESDARYSLYIDVYGIALADGHVSTQEDSTLLELQRALNISDEEAATMREFADAAAKMAAAGDEADSATKEAFKHAAAQMAAVGVPLGAVAASGAVAGLSAAGITSGLAALGMGFGMVSGIGTCVVLGLVTYKGIRWLLK